MDFLTAVKALQAGECEGIIRDCQKGKLHLIISRGRIVWSNFRINSALSPEIDWLLADDWILVNPIPRTETREATTFGVVVDGNVEMIDEEESGCDKWATKYGGQVVKLTAPYQVEVKPKVKRRKEIGVMNKGIIKRNVGFTQQRECPQMKAKLFAEWEE